MNPGGGREVTINVSGTLPDGDPVRDSATFRIKDIPPPIGNIRGETGDGGQGARARGDARRRRQSGGEARRVRADYATDGSREMQERFHPETIFDGCLYARCGQDYQDSRSHRTRGGETFRHRLEPSFGSNRRQSQEHGVDEDEQN